MKWALNKRTTNSFKSVSMNKIVTLLLYEYLYVVIYLFIYKVMRRSISLDKNKNLISFHQLFFDVL